MTSHQSGTVTGKPTSGRINLKIGVIDGRGKDIVFQSLLNLGQTLLSSKETMRILNALLIFYRKLIIPVLVLSGLLGLMGFGITGEFFFDALGISFIILALLFHYFVYEIRNYNEYYFYYNMGLSRLTLWITTFILSSMIGLIFILL